MSHTLFRPSLGLIAAAIAAITYPPPPADACQKLPLVECHVSADPSVITGPTPVRVDFSVTNFPVSAPYPPPFLDDLNFDVSVAQRDNWFCSTGATGPPAGPVDIEPNSYSVELDEAFSPFADEPVTDTRTITVTPSEPLGLFAIEVSACGDVDGVPPCERQCTVHACVTPLDHELQENKPYAEFVSPSNTGAAGSRVPFALRVRRNGYAPGTPLTVVVTPTNFSDPSDLFPISPPDLTSSGRVVTGDEALIEFACDLPYPCFRGVANTYHVSIYDGPNVVWTSWWFAPSLAYVVVDDAPLARQELVAIDDGGGDGALTVGEEGTIHLRLYGRNPHFGDALLAARLETALPAGLTVASYDLHHHDNPLDRVDPTPAQLAATGTVDLSAGFAVDTASIDARFQGDPPFPPPEVFRDLYEVELLLATPLGGFPAPVELRFPGVTLSGTSAAGPVAATSDELVVLVAPGTDVRPNPVPNLYAVKTAPGSAGDVKLPWDDPPVDLTHGQATSFRLYLDQAAPPVAYAELVEGPDTAARTEEYRHIGAVSPTAPHAPTHLYRITAVNAGGDSGDAP